MNRMVRGDAVDGAQCFHAEEIAPDDWRYWAAGYCGILIGNRQSVITELANAIGRSRQGGLERLHALHSPDIPYLILDELGNTWLDHEYLSADRYLPLLIPVNAGLTPNLL